MERGRRCVHYKPQCDLEKQFQEERRKSKLQVSTPNINEAVEEAKGFETVVEIEEVVACGANEKVVDISMPTTILESSEDEEFVIGCI